MGLQPEVINPNPEDGAAHLATSSPMPKRWAFQGRSWHTRPCKRCGPHRQERGQTPWRNRRTSGISVLASRRRPPRHVRSPPMRGAVGPARLFRPAKPHELVRNHDRPSAVTRSHVLDRHGLPVIWNFGLRLSGRRLDDRNRRAEFQRLRRAAGHRLFRGRAATLVGSFILGRHHRILHRLSPLRAIDHVGVIQIHARVMPSRMMRPAMAERVSPWPSSAATLDCDRPCAQSSRRRVSRVGSLAHGETGWDVGRVI